MTQLQAVFGLGVCVGVMLGVLLLLLPDAVRALRPHKPRRVDEVHVRANGKWVKLWERDQ